MVFTKQIRSHLYEIDGKWPIKLAIRTLLSILCALSLAGALTVWFQRSNFAPKAFLDGKRVVVLVPGAGITILWNLLNLLFLSFKRRPFSHIANTLAHFLLGVAFAIVGVYATLVTVQAYKALAHDIYGVEAEGMHSVIADDGSMVFVTAEDVSSCPAFKNCIAQTKWWAMAHRRRLTALVACALFDTAFIFHVMFFIWGIAEAVFGTTPRTMAPPTNPNAPSKSNSNSNSSRTLFRTPSEKDLEKLSDSSGVRSNSPSPPLPLGDGKSPSINVTPAPFLGHGQEYRLSNAYPTPRMSASDPNFNTSSSFHNPSPLSSTTSLTNSYHAAPQHPPLLRTAHSTPNLHASDSLPGQALTTSTASPAPVRSCTYPTPQARTMTQHSSHQSSTSRQENSPFSSTSTSPYPSAMAVAQSAQQRQSTVSFASFRLSHQPPLNPTHQNAVFHAASPNASTPSIFHPPAGSTRNSTAGSIHGAFGLSGEVEEGGSRLDSDLDRRRTSSVYSSGSVGSLGSLMGGPGPRISSGPGVGVGGVGVGVGAYVDAKERRKSRLRSVVSYD